MKFNPRSMVDWSLAIVCLAITGFIVWGLFDGGPVRARPETRERAHINSIAMALMQYKSDHEGVLPPDLRALCPKYMSDSKYLSSQVTGAPFVYSKDGNNQLNVRLLLWPSVPASSKAKWFCAITDEMKTVYFEVDKLKELH